MPRRILVIFSMAAVSSCSLIADPDAFTYIEGSATAPDDTGSETTPESSDVETDTQTEIDTGSSRDTAHLPDLVCTQNDDCPRGAVCPILFNNDLMQEDESHCYVNCRADSQLCDGTDHPLCYQYTGGAICLTRTTITGEFACRLLTPTVGNQIELKVRPDDTPIRLERCEMFSDDDGLGFVFSTVLDGAVIEAAFYIPNVRIGDLQTGLAENATGEVFRKVLDDAMSPIESSMLGFLPPGDPPQNPALTRDIDITDITTAGPIRGEIRFDGFAYNAQMRI